MSELFIRAWMTFSLMVIGGASIVALLAWRAGLFNDQERARHLALYSQVQEEGEEED